MEIHWRNPNGIDEEERVAAEQRLQGLAQGHTDLIDLWIDVARTPHHRKGAEEVTIRCQARGAELVAHLTGGTPRRRSPCARRSRPSGAR
jgi:hypothetical protein